MKSILEALNVTFFEANYYCSLDVSSMKDQKATNRFMITIIVLIVFFNEIKLSS